jgi:protein-tyrosine phosphatase
MIETHLHTVPGVDDWPETIEESLALAKVLVGEGIHAAIATLHSNDLFPQRSAAEIKERVNELQQVLDRQGILLHLFWGHDGPTKPGLVEDMQAGRLAILNGSSYILRELWSNTWLSETERIIFEPRAFEYIPFIAHPRRYRVIQQNPDRLVDLLQQGVSTQSTASSLTGTWDKTIQCCVETLVKKRLISCIASDAHSSCKRLPSGVRGSQCALTLTDQAYLKLLIETFHIAFINNETILVAVRFFSEKL